jgi:hypothetical protein
MKRILLSFSVTALLAVTGGIFAAEGGPPAWIASPNSSATNDSSVAGNGFAVVRIKNLPSSETTALAVKVNDQQTSVNPTTNGKVLLASGTNPKYLRIEVTAPDGKTLKCKNINVIKGHGAMASATATKSPIDEITLMVSKHGNDYRCTNVEVTTDGGIGATKLINN